LEFAGGFYCAEVRELESPFFKNDHLASNIETTRRSIFLANYIFLMRSFAIKAFHVTSFGPLVRPSSDLAKYHTKTLYFYVG